jgi:basic membrane protein A
VTRSRVKVPAHRSRRGSATVALAVLALSGLLAACGGSGGSGGASGGGQASGSSGPLKVGVFFPGSVSDTGFMESGYRGYQRAQKALGDAVQLSYVEKVEATDYEQALVRFASRNDVVVSMGGQTDADVRKVAPQFPDVKFVEIGGPADAKPMPNLAYYDPQQAEAEYLGGAVAAASSKSGRIAYIGGIELPAIVNASKSFANGAKATRKDINILSPQYVGDFNDPSKAKQSAAAVVGAGADVLGQQLNLGKQGLEQVLAPKSGRMIAGPIAGDCSNRTVAGYVVTDTGKEIEYAINAVRDGSWKAAQVPFGLTTQRGGTNFKLCMNDPAVKSALEKAKQSVATGRVKPY